LICRPAEGGPLLKSQWAQLLSSENETCCNAAQKSGQNTHSSLYFIVPGQAPLIFCVDLTLAALPATAETLSHTRTLGASGLWRTHEGREFTQKVLPAVCFFLCECFIAALPRWSRCTAFSRSGVRIVLSHLGLCW